MALKKKLSKEEYKKLSDIMKAEYKEDGESYVLDVEGEEDVSGLKSALDKEKGEKKIAKEKLLKAEERLAELEEKANGEEKNVDKVREGYEKKLEKQKKESDEKIGKLRSGSEKLLVDNTALEIATSLAGKNAKLILPHVKERLKADVEGDDFKTLIVGSDGKTLELNKETREKFIGEFVANKEFSSIIIASKATGGHGQGSGTTKPANNQNEKPTLLASLSAQDMADHIKASKNKEV